MCKRTFASTGLKLVVVVLLPLATACAETILIDDFNDGNDVGWRHFNYMPGPPVGPAVFDASSTAYQMKNGGSQPINTPHYMASAWEDSLSSLQSMHGFLRAKVTADTEGSLPWLFMRAAEPEHQDGSYIFLANSVSHRFQIERGGDPYLVFPIEDPTLQFHIGEAWIVEGGTVGDQITMKVWREGDPEPAAPQLTITDSKFMRYAGFGLGGNVLKESQPGFLDITFDDVYFTSVPPILGDFNYDRVVDVRDIELLSREIAKTVPSLEFDLNEDQEIDLIDHDIWVHAVKNTWLGDANLDGEFDTGDLVQVLEAGKYEKMIGDTSRCYPASWDEGDWNADRCFNTNDIVAALIDGGYEKGPRMPAVAVPEPGAWLLSMAALSLWIVASRSRCPIGRPL